jgi:fructose-1-phosphate kinase PfkB-like protein
VRELLTPDRVANQIRLRRSTFLGAFLLVEGSSDKVFYERFIDKTVCELVIVAGKPSSKIRVMTVLRILEDSSFHGVLAIVDADFDRLETSAHHSPNLLRTDTHDLETMLIDSPALDKVIAEFGSEEKIAEFGSVRAALVDAGISIGGF